MTRPRKPDGITRRRFVNGVAVGVAGTVAGAPLPFASEASAPRRVIRSGAPLSYSASLAGFPPLRGGLRGSHEGANEVAHQMPFDGRSDWGPAAEPDLDLYDLVVVGGGISGLAAAHFYRKAHPDARILILENHDDIGGPCATQRVPPRRPPVSFGRRQPLPDARRVGRPPGRGVQGLGH